ncbi:uncharacterized protein LOC111058067 isoform X1 [Nilaparvata lugens]|uniref:uncharacterized protein LOC111058067 isoform X1 n=1 Tax=Nilaparvata lugens TaxID=108931 RepID=UPI00193DE90A|nr:uncharacterized protein LOC111058067 isoform X1 [Nilaparvata lugens]
MLNSSDLDKFILERTKKIAEARKEINYKQQCLKLEYSPRGADEKENKNVSNRTSFQVLNQKKKEASRNEKQISPLQSNRQMPLLPPVDILHESNASSVIETRRRHRNPHGEVALVNCRELEKQRLASVMASTTGSAVLGGNSTQKSPQRTRLVVAKPLHVASSRQLEIDRLAKLFESSQESCLRNSRIVADEYPKTTEQSPTACHTVCPALTTFSGDDQLSRRENDLAEISVNDADLSNNNDTNEWIPSNLNTSEQGSNQSTTQQGNDCVDCLENENCLRKPTLSVSVPGSLLIGVGEYEAKRNQLLKERRMEFCDYMKQAHLKVRNPRGEPQISYCSHDVVRLKDIATQTDDEPPNPYLLEPDDYRVMGGGLSLPTSPEYSHRSRSPMRSPRGRGNLDLHKSAYCFPGISPSTPVFDKPADEVGKPTSEMYIRQYQYREELKKQIEERQKLEAERKERERLEEEAIERRVREQQEKLRRQYEIEEQERLDYIMRRHIQDDVLRQRLADIQLHDTREKPAGGKEKRMRPVKVTHCSNQEPQPSQEDSNQVPAAEPGDPVSQLIESAEAMLKAPLLAENDARLANNDARLANNDARVVDNDARVTHTACSVPLPPPLPPSPRLETHSVAGRRQADEMLHEPLLSPGDASPCRRQPVLKAVSPCVGVKPRSNNDQIVDNKWQVPLVEESHIQPRAALGNYADQLHSSPDNVLTQLSSFRRQLQMEHFKLIERMQQQSKRRSP